MNMLLLVVGCPLLGIMASLWLTRGPVVSGKLALAFSLLPYAGVGLGIAFC